MILAMSLPCWLIPVLTGLISALLGYLLGRSGGNEWKDKALKFEADFDACKKERIKLESDLKVANAITSNDSGLENEIASLKSELLTWKDKASNLETQVDSLQSVSANVSSNDVASSLTSDTSEFETKIADLEAKLALSQANERSFEEEVSQLKTKAGDLETQVASFSAGASNDTEQWKNRVASLEENLKSTHETKAKLEADLKALRDKNTQLESDLSASNQTSQKGGDEAEIWKNRVADLQEKLVASKTEMTSLQAELKEAKNTSSNTNEVATLKNKVASLEEELRKAKTNVAPTIENTSSIASSLAGASAVAFDAGAAKAIFGKKIKQDDLTIVEGIGPKIQGLFHDFGVKTWVALSECSQEKCQEVLDSGGPRYRMHNPSTWPKQAGFAAEGKWAELKKWQEELDGGR